VPQVAQDLDLLPQVAQVALALALLADELERDHAPRGAAAALVHLPIACGVCFHCVRWVVVSRARV
jgi:hypothetical protein